MEKKIINEEFQEKKMRVRKSPGRKKQYGEDTVTWAFRCPKSKLEYMKELVRQKLETWEMKK